ncbi:hypothetical protein Q1695_003985 [Nippostrongylus brasiliensis]|nr:hypothetical protein Q1695_003985 [Nippostrongylus brasiliensis]
MKRNTRSKAASLYQFWTAQQQDQERARTTPSRVLGSNRSPDVVDLTDSPMEHLNIAPLSNTATPEQADKNPPPSWASLLKRSTTSDPSAAPKYIPPPLRHISPASEEELEKAGFDPLEGTSIRYPADEYIRQFEVDILKSCVAANSAVALPMAVSADHICAVVFHNFLRWFPRSRGVFCCNSLDEAQMFKERCVTVGIPDDEVSIVDTFQTFKKIPIHKVGRVIVTTPQAFEKIVESDSEVIGDIRCMAFCMDASGGHGITKYKHIVGDLTVKGIIFRVILVTPSVPSRSRKLGPLRKRQQIITSLIISQWIEPSPSDLSFRNNVVPLGMSVEYCTSEEVLSETRSAIEKWLDKSRQYLESLNDLIPLPSTDPRHLFSIDWVPIATKASDGPADTVQLVVNCMFLVEAARNLIVHGPRVFYLYCAELFGLAGKEQRASNIALMVLSDVVLSKVSERIQQKYSYNSDAIFDITFANSSLSSHSKYSRLKALLEKYGNPLRCLVLCENEHVSRVVCEALDTPRLRNAIIRVLPQENVPPTLRKHYRLPSQCTGIFRKPDAEAIIVMGVNVPDFTNTVDTLCSNQLSLVVSMDRRSICLLEGHNGQHVAILDADCEKLRPTDGRLINISDEMSGRRSSLFGAEGMIQRYNFSYEFSRLQLPSSKMEFVQYIPAVSRQKEVCNEHIRRQGFELTSNEFSEFYDRLTLLPAVERGLYSSNRSFVLLGHHLRPLAGRHFSEKTFGEVPCGKLRKRLEEYLKGGDLLKKRVKRQFEYNEDLIDKDSIEFCEKMIEKLNKLLSL